jgi:hypothetical protein
MAHDHLHEGESVRDYFTEQLLTILVCGLIGVAAIEMYRRDMLGFLAEQFRAPVLYGGIGVLVLVGLRAIAVWRQAGEIQARMQGCTVDHTHGPECNHVHIHEEDDNDHSHSHDMSWVFARMVILVFPVMLFFLGLPGAALSPAAQLRMINDSAMGAESLKKLAEGAEVIEEQKNADGTTVRILKTKTGLKIRERSSAAGGEPMYELVAGEGTPMRFNELNDAAFDAGKRQYYEGQTAILEGRLKRLGDKEFSLFRMKMTCCAADTVPLKVRIIVPQALSKFADFDWVRVKGQIQFLKAQGQDRYIPVIMVADLSDVRLETPKNEYEQ